MLNLLRSSAFALCAALITPPYALLALAIFFLPPMMRYRIISTWSVAIVWLARIICGVRWKVTGMEHLPAVPSIILSKHQSAWETLAFQAIFPPQVWVLKRSLLWVPFVGWGIGMLSPIAIDRSQRVRALKQTLEQGRARLARGFWVVVFPEGSRVDPGTRGTWQIGGAWLATHAGAPVVPIAVNSGELWPRNGFMKHAGTIEVRILEPIDPSGMKAEALSRLVEQRVEDAMLQLNGKARSR
jgi:1-acyl-sn-glycerol-3-phosphate acyltransferase